MSQLTGLPPQDTAFEQAVLAVLAKYKNIAGGIAGLDSSAFVDTENLGSGTASSATVLYGNNTWGAASGALAAGDYGDIELLSGTNWRVEAYGGVTVVHSYAELTAAVAAATSGGVIHIAPGTYTLTSTLATAGHNLTLRGCGKGVTILQYTADANTDLISIRHSFVTIENMTICGTTYSTATNGMGAAGTGRGIVIEQADADAGGPSWDNCTYPTIRNVEVLCTGSWCIYDTGTTALTQSGSRPTLHYGYPGNVNTTKAISVNLTIDNCSLSFPNSDGVLYIGSGAAAPRISELKTNSYSYNTFERIDSAGGVDEPMGAVFLYNASDAVFDRKCEFQSPAAQVTGVTTRHYDNDATMISLLNSSPCHLEAPYFEVLSGSCAGTHVDGGPAAGTTTAGRTHWFITAINSNGFTINSSYFVSSVSDGASPADGYALRIMHTPADSHAVGVTFNEGVAYHHRLQYDSAAAPPRTASAPYENGDPMTWDRDDFVFGGFSDGEKETPININDFRIINRNSGNVREPTTPAAGDGSTIISGPAVRFSNNSRPIQLGVWSSMEPSGSASADDFRQRWALSHLIRGGVMGYVSDGGALDGAIQREGLWLSSTRGNDFRQIPYIRMHTSAWADVYAGDMWHELGGASGGVYTTDKFHFYDNGVWRTIVGIARGTTAAGDLIYYTAADTPARLAIGNTADVFTVLAGVPAWKAVVVDGNGDVVTSGGELVYS